MTTQSPASKHTDKHRFVLRIFLALTMIGGIITLRSLLMIPAEAESIALFGLSWERMLLAGGILGPVVGAAGLLLASWTRKPFFSRLTVGLINKIQNKSIWGWSVLFSGLALFGCLYLIALTPEITEPFTLAYFVRLQPLIAWAAVLCAQILLVLPLLRYGFDLHPIKPRSRIAYQIAGVFLTLLLIWIMIAQTQLGLTRSHAGAGWYQLGAPVLEIQAIAAWIIALLYIGLALWGENHPAILARAGQFKLPRIDLMISFLLWIGAFAIWNSLPLTPNWFAAPPRSPNQAIYPNSDAYLYDTTGQTLLTGEGLKTLNAPFAIRPLYATFLGVLHALGGFDYEPIIWMQVAVLALIPVVLYWITLFIHNRISALIVGSLMIFREANAIILGGSITTSHSKLIMADLPTTLGVTLLILILVRWLQKPVQRQPLTLIAGGLTGAFMLIRPEFAVLLPFLGLAALMELKGRKLWFKSMLLIALGTTLFLSPWIWRNYQITGTIFLDSPHYRSDLLALRYQDDNSDAQGNAETSPEGVSEDSAEDLSPQNTPQTSETAPTAIAETAADLQSTPTPQIAYQPGEKAEDFASRMFGRALDYARNNFGSVVYSVSNHFFNSQVQTVLYLPVTYRMFDSAIAFMGNKDPVKFWAACCSADGYIRRLPFWFKWDGVLPQQSIPPLALNLFLVSLGLAESWKRQKYIALLPISASLGYTLINALVRNSGGRYILPIDWIGIFYYSIGIGQVTLWTTAYFRGAKLPARMLGGIQPSLEDRNAPPQRKTILGAAILILLFGCMIPVAEKVVPDRYQPDLLAKRQTQLFQTLDIPLESLLSNGGSVVQGRGLYPRFHAANDGETGIRRTPFSPLPFARLDFFMVGPYNGGIVLAQEAISDQFPNGADVLAVGCPGEEYFDAMVLVIYGEDGEPNSILLQEPFPDVMECPFVQPK